MNVQQMISAHPTGSNLSTDALQTCIEACFECAQTCTACADACLDEDGEMDMRHCIRTDLDCADVCLTTGKVLSRQTEPSWDLLKAQVGACFRACQEGGEECRSHGDHHEHCKVCGASCHNCEEACDQLLTALGSVAGAA